MSFFSSVKAHGGTTAQLATHQESLFVVYSGSTTRRSSPAESNISLRTLSAFDIKRIIEKTQFDIIRPQWILDCAQRGELVPLRKKYFFHAPTARMEDEEYDLSDSEDEPTPSASMPSGNLTDEDEVARALAMSKASWSEPDSEHSEWFKVEPDVPKISGKVDDSETEEDNDSDNYDLNESDTVDDDDDEWFSVPRETQMKGEAKVTSSTTMGTQSSEGFDLVQAPRIQDPVVGFALPLILTHV